MKQTIQTKNYVQTQNCLWDPKSTVIFENVTSRSRETYVKPEDQDEVLESEDSLKDEEAAKKAAYKELKLQVSLFIQFWTLMLEDK